MPSFLLTNASTRALRAGFITAALAVSSLVSAQSYPNKPVNFLVGWPPGGSTDFIARTLAPELARQLGQPVVIENLAGAGSVIALQKAFNASPDGYTIYLGGTELIVPPLVNAKVQYDWKTKLTPVGQFAFVWFVLAANNNAPYSTLQGLVDHARRNPDKVAYASAGVASTQHMLGELIRERTGAPIVHVPYRGGPQFTQDLLAGTIDTAWLTVAGMLAQAPGGKVKPLAVSSANRIPQLPGVPALSELKEMAGVSMGAWMGLFVPVGTPAQAQQKLSAALEAAMKAASVTEPLEKAGAVVQWTDGPTFGRFIEAEIPNYRRIVDFAKMKVTE